MKYYWVSKTEIEKWELDFFEKAIAKMDIDIELKNSEIENIL